MNANSSTWIFLRLFGIVVGIATLLRLATVGFHVEYQAFFQAFLDEARSLLELDLLIDPLEKVVHSVIEWIRSFGWTVPDLRPHWRPVFTLSWLLLATFARNRSGNVALQFVWAFICALVGAILAGMQSLESLAVVFLAPGSILLFFAGFLVSDHLFDRSRFRGQRAFLFLMFIVVVSYFLGILATSFITDSVGGRALLALIGAVGVIGLIFAAASDTAGATWREWLDDPSVTMCLDIWSVIGGALAICYFMMK